jgi:hypothetical protein
MNQQLQDIMGLDNSYNDVILTKTTLKALTKAFKGYPHERYSNNLEKWFVLWNDNAEEELSKILPLYSSGNPVYQIGNHAFKVGWDWSIMKWLVSA